MLLKSKPPKMSSKSRNTEEKSWPPAPSSPAKPNWL